jgi:tRNA A-37 threonylcarbamoyl transferase component Bud32
VDVIHRPESGTALLSKARAYAALQTLQGHVIPKFYGYYNVWGILKILALEPVGTSIPKDQKISGKLCQKMKSTLGRMHSTRYLHSDITCHNFCERDGKVFLVDLEMCREARNQAEKDAEQQKVDSL